MQDNDNQPGNVFSPGGSVTGPAAPVITPETPPQPTPAPPTPTEQPTATTQQPAMQPAVGIQSAATNPWATWGMSTPTNNSFIGSIGR